MCYADFENGLEADPCTVELKCGTVQAYRVVDLDPRNF